MFRQSQINLHFTVTELEMKVGILEETLAHKISQNVLCLCRMIEDVYDKLDRHKAKRFVDLEPGLTDIVQYKHGAIMKMKRKVKETVPSANIFERTIR